MVTIDSIRVEVEREQDGRILASVPDFPGVMAYGSSDDEAIRKVKAIALCVLADMIESGEEVPEPFQVLVRGVGTKRESLRALLRDLVEQHGQPAPKDIRWAERVIRPERRTLAR